LVNKDAQKEVDCKLGMGKIDGIVEAIILSGYSPDAYNDIDKPDRVVHHSKQINIKNGKVTVPAPSLVILTIDKSGK
jgi:alpha-L-arabinofuranosidase